MASPMAFLRPSPTVGRPALGRDGDRGDQQGDHHHDPHVLHRPLAALIPPGPLDHRHRRRVQPGRDRVAHVPPPVRHDRRPIVRDGARAARRPTVPAGRPKRHGVRVLPRRGGAAARRRAAAPRHAPAHEGLDDVDEDVGALRARVARDHPHRLARRQCAHVPRVVPQLARVPIGRRAIAVGERSAGSGRVVRPPTGSSRRTASRSRSRSRAPAWNAASASCSRATADITPRPTARRARPMGRSPRAWAVSPR